MEVWRYVAQVLTAPNAGYLHNIKKKSVSGLA